MCTIGYIYISYTHLPDFSQARPFFQLLKVTFLRFSRWTDRSKPKGDGVLFPKINELKKSRGYKFFVF